MVTAKRAFEGDDVTDTLAALVAGDAQFDVAEAMTPANDDAVATSAGSPRQSPAVRWWIVAAAALVSRRLTAPQHLGVWTAAFDSPGSALGGSGSPPEHWLKRTGASC